MEESKTSEVSEKYYGEERPSPREAEYLKRSTLQERKGQYGLAIANMRRAVEIAPQRASNYARLAVLCRAARRFDEALSALRAAAECDPSNPELREMLLQICMEAGRYEEAIREGKKLLKQWPRNIYARDVLSMAYLHNGDYIKALRVTDQLILIDPLDPMNHLKKAIIFQQKGEIGEAMGEYARVVDLDPEGEVGEDAQEAMSSLDDLQLRQIITLALEDGMFRAKLARDPDTAAAERGFVLSPNAAVALRQIDLDSMSQGDDAPPSTYVYS